MPTTPPKPTEIELSLFGPGFGESIVLHVGNGKWVIVDSCIYAGKPTALTYLKSLGVDVTQDVVMVVASHWHDDHIRGLATTVEECESATFVCPNAMGQKDFIMIAKAYENSGLGEHSGINEFGQIYKVLCRQSRVPAYATAARTLHTYLKTRDGWPFDINVVSLSPSDSVVASYVARLAAQITKQGNKVRASPLGPNLAAVVIQVIAGDGSLLLGSDMESTSPHGWRLIIQDTNRPQAKSHGYKVAHHGSKSGHDPAVWDNLLQPTPFAFITPFRLGGLKLPTTLDVSLIKTLAKRAYITTPLTAATKSRPLPKDVERTVKEHGIRINLGFTTRGQIRYRFTPDNPAPHSVFLFNGAVQL